MTKTVDVSSKRLISLAPTDWVQWVTGDTQAEAQEFLGSELQFVSRRQRHSDQGALSPTLLGLSAHQQFRVINLWELDASHVLENGMPTLLPFVPIMRGGERVDIVQRALFALPSDANLADLDTFLIFMARFVLDSKTILPITRWDMATLRENPWYAEILAEGREEGRVEGREEALLEVTLHALGRRFGAADATLAASIRQLPNRQLLSLIDQIYTAASLEEVTEHLRAVTPAAEP